jgi:hypothetical protein
MDLQNDEAFNHPNHFCLLEFLDIMSNFNMRRIIKLGKRHGARR